MGRRRRTGYASGLEEQVAAQLDEAGQEFEYESLCFTYTEPLRKNLAECGDCGSRNLIRTGRYTPDFVLPNGYIIETKGRWTAQDRRKMVAVRDEYTDYTFVMLFQRDNKLKKNAKSYYSDWCNANGFDYSVETIKMEWLGDSNGKT